MKWLPLKRFLLPITLGLLGLLLLARVLLSNTFVLLAEDVDVIILVILLSVTMVIAIHTIVRISIDHLRLRSVQQVRRETLAEHQRFLSRLDHELKNPLTTLHTGLKTLGLTTLDAQQRQFVDTMETETLRLNRLISDLRKLAELEAEPLNLQPVSMRAFVENVLQLERERFEAGQRSLTSQVEAQQDTWVVDEDLLALAVHNLLDNAFKYTRAGDHVQLCVAVQHELVLQITDNGIGISPASLPHVWEELYRGHQIKKIPGSGIGLALVKAIVERHGGHVLIQSDREHGTTVEIHLPPLS